MTCKIIPPNNYLRSRCNVEMICAGGSATTIGGDALFGAIIEHTSCVQCEAKTP